jgi:hypothetical protein
MIGPGTISGHKPPSGKHANIIAGSINGKDIADRSGVDTCQTPLVAKYGPICVGSDGGSRTWLDALNYCTGFGLRLPTTSEAVALAKKFDVPGGQCIPGFLDGRGAVLQQRLPGEVRVRGRRIQHWS